WQVSGEPDLGALGRDGDRILHERVDWHFVRARMVPPVHRGFGAAVEDDRRQTRVDRHANLVVLAAWELSCPEESRRAPLESEEVDALPGLGDDRPVPNEIGRASGRER